MRTPTCCYVSHHHTVGISYANLNQYEESAKAYLQALNLTPSAKHIWGYLRVVFTCMDRMDLAEMSGREDPGLLAAEIGVALIPPLEP
jgi:tetratricopeptide (TPR) repeat protein